MRIKSIELKNIGAFEHETIEFQPCPVKDKAEIHIFTGTNGSGKSTVLKALAAAFEGAGVTPKGDVACKTDTNSLSKYMRFKNENSGGRVCLELKQEDHCIEYVHCPSGREHLHIESQDHPDILNYRITSLLDKIPKGNTFYSAFFSYSSERVFNFSGQNGGNTVNRKNPLYQALEFIKTPNPAFRIESWIEESLLKQSYAINHGFKEKENDFTNTITNLQNAISEIVGFPVEFKMDKQIREPKIVYNNFEHDLDVLPDGLRSIISWLADLCMRLELLDWEGDMPVFDRNVILFLDEIEVHLHIEWQRKILPVIQKLLPNAQIFLSTHSPFVINSVDDAWVYNLEVKDGNATVRKAELTQDGNSVSFVLSEILGVNEEFGIEVEKDLKQFYQYRDKALVGKISEKEMRDMMVLVQKLGKQSVELESIVAFDLRQINKQIKIAEKV
jgi:predicted ATP-binding protein involved in virulence